MQRIILEKTLCELCISSAYLARNAYCFYAEFSKKTERFKKSFSKLLETVKLSINLKKQTDNSHENSSKIKNSGLTDSKKRELKLLFKKTFLFL